MIISLVSTAFQPLSSKAQTTLADTWEILGILGNTMDPRRPLERDAAGPLPDSHFS